MPTGSISETYTQGVRRSNPLDSTSNAWIPSKRREKASSEGGHFAPKLFPRRSLGFP